MSYPLVHSRADIDISSPMKIHCDVDVPVIYTDRPIHQRGTDRPRSKAELEGKIYEIQQ